MHLVPANEDVAILLSAVLRENGMTFDTGPGLFELTEPGDPGRVLSRLRQLLSEPERQAVGVLSGVSTAPGLPSVQPLDRWWQIHQTGWFQEAMAGNRFETWFQPIVDTARHRILAHECLIRLNTLSNPRGGRLYNGGEIVDAARTRNEIHAFDAHARSLAIRSAARQPVQENPLFFVNFMPSSIYNPEHCMKSTLATLQESGLRPENIVFEVVESDLIRDPSHLRGICDYYRRHGFAFALDDLGTGSNSLQLLCDLHPDYIKLDKSLVANVEQPMYAATIRKLVELAGQFGVGVIAEGVEKAETMENLWLLGVQWMQGYFFGRPAPGIVRQSDDAYPDTDLANLARSLDEACRAAARQLQT